MEGDLNVLATLPIWFLVFLFSTTCHEASHALVAKLGGDLTAYQGGHVSLDPLPHIRRSPMGMVVVPILSFIYIFATRGTGWMLGWASVPLDPFWAARHPRRAALVSLAGPTANFLILVGAAVAIRIGIATGHLGAPSHIGFDHVVATATGGNNALTVVLSILFSLNLILATFNLLPVPPLDGHGVVPLFLSPRLASRWHDLFREGMFGMIGLFVAWSLYGKIFSSVFFGAIGLLYSGLATYS
ncbi:MAG: site-2 protease family protein [Deltaproteobacteria bacterium]|nr:site-2 protease family protein [Deltaproteobacteria bacterium]